jgi:hypothetical protein
MLSCPPVRLVYCCSCDEQNGRHASAAQEREGGTAVRGGGTGCGRGGAAEGSQSREGCEVGQGAATELVAGWLVCWPSCCPCGQAGGDSWPAGASSRVQLAVHGSRPATAASGQVLQGQRGHFHCGCSSASLAVMRTHLPSNQRSHSSHWIQNSPDLLAGWQGQTQAGTGGRAGRRVRHRGQKDGQAGSMAG